MRTLSMSQKCYLHCADFLFITTKTAAATTPLSTVPSFSKAHQNTKQNPEKDREFVFPEIGPTKLLLAVSWC